MEEENERRQKLEEAATALLERFKADGHVDSCACKPCMLARAALLFLKAHSLYTVVLIPPTPKKTKRRKKK